jgi:hypothetical protein
MHETLSYSCRSQTAYVLAAVGGGGGVTLWGGWLEMHISHIFTELEHVIPLTKPGMETDYNESYE